MKLKSLRLFGFKTFADQTTLAFEPGVTAIVGPNGSGKSNLVDAIRWVLGEQSARSLRSSKTEDVIFAGNERRKPLGMAEVALTFDNEERRLRVDAAEVQLTRRAYRGGDSEFFINREQVRLRDLVELLMGTGLGPGSYAIVSQGHIDAILSSKPTERRALFEETAGISRFLASKNESLRRLEQTERNGIRISDLLTEIAMRIPELETQARRSRRFRKASTRLRDLEILTYLRASSSRREERDRLQAEMARLEAGRAIVGGKVATLDIELSTLRTQLYAHDRKLESLRIEATQARTRLAEIEARHAATAARREVLERQFSQMDFDRDRVVAERVELEASITRIEAEIEPQTAELERIVQRERQAYQALTAARACLERIFGELREVEARAASVAANEAGRRARLQAARDDFERLAREMNELRDAAQEKREALASRLGDIEQTNASVESLQTQLLAAEQAVVRVQTRVDEAVRKLAELQEALRAVSAEIAGNQARLHTIEELEANLEGHVPGTRAVLEAYARGDLSGIHGVVSKLIDVDEAHARALDIAFGAALSNIVTATAEDAQRAIKYLCERELGRATFLPLDRLVSRNGRGASSVPRAQGMIGYAHTLVRTEPAYQGIVAFLVGRMLIVDSLEAALDLVRGTDWRDTVVTLEGDEIRDGGAMTGGRSRRERSLLSRAAQARSLREGIPQMCRELARLEKEMHCVAQESAAATRERDETRRVVGELAGALREAQARVQGLVQERAYLEQEAMLMLERSGEREAQSARVCARLRDLELPEVDSSTTHERHDHLEGALTQARVTIAQFEESQRAIGVEATAARQANAALVAQRDAVRARLSSLDHNHARGAQVRETMRLEISALVEDISQSTKERDASLAMVSQAEAVSEEARLARERMAARASELDASLRAAQGAQRDAAQANDGARLRLAEVDAELGMLAAQFAQNPATSDECAEIERRCAEETGDCTAEINRLRDEIARLQNVNLNAEAEIEELIERERFLKEQLDDMARAKEILLAGIAEIEQQSHEQFNAVFARVCKIFSEVYARMFPGGQAKMWLTGADHLAEVGVEISAQPPGKKMMALTSLSGGERAMTSAALIFALITVKPSPFYLLDEVDAALDESNVSCFSQMLRDLAKEAQMLIITHNKQTMELVDRMYGVTMSEPGISSIIAAQLSGPGLQESEQRVVAVSA